MMNLFSWLLTLYLFIGLIEPVLTIYVCVAKYNGLPGARLKVIYTLTLNVPFQVHFKVFNDFRSVCLT